MFVTLYKCLKLTLIWQGLTCINFLSLTSDLSSGLDSLAESMWHSVSMTNSMMLAQDCLKQDPSPGEQKAAETQPFEGPELLAQTIDSGKMSDYGYS